MELVQQAAAVVAVLGLLAATLWWLRRRGLAGVPLGRKPGGRRLECLERLPLGPQHTLHLIRMGETTLLVATSAAGCALLEPLAYARGSDQSRDREGASQ